MLNYSSSYVYNKEKDIEDIVSANNISIKKNTLIPEKDEKIIKDFVSDLLKIQFQKNEEINKKIFQVALSRLRKKYNINPKKSQ